MIIGFLFYEFSQVKLVWRGRSLDANEYASFNEMFIVVHMHVCVCVCEREIERER